MAQAPVEFKKALKAAGLWTGFIAFRQGLRDKGEAPTPAHNIAMAEFTTRLATHTEATPSSSEEDADGASLDPDRCPGKGTPLLEDYAEFLGRSADIIVVIQWVAKHLEVPPSAIRIEDAPSAEAWGMLMSYQRTPTRKADFWDRVFTKLIPSRATLDGDVAVKVDGESVIATVDKILALKQAAEGDG